MAHRGCADIIVAQGNHAVKGLANPQVSEGQIEIFHFPVRSYDQIENKIVKGGAAYENNRELPGVAGRTWRQRYQDLKRDSNLNSYYEECCHDESRRAEKLASGEILVDRRLSEHFATRLGR